MIGWYGAVTLALSPLGGTLIDRFGARRVVLPCLLIEAVGTGSLALVSRPRRRSLVMTVIADRQLGDLAGQNTILASLTDADERQRVFGLNFALLNLGIGVGGLISGAIVDIARPVTFQTDLPAGRGELPDAGADPAEPAAGWATGSPAPGRAGARRRPAATWPCCGTARSAGW